MVVATKKPVDVLVPPNGLADRPNLRDNKGFLTIAKNIEISNEAKGPFLKQRQAFLEMFDLSVFADNELENQFYADLVFKSSNGNSWYIIHAGNKITVHKITKTGLSSTTNLVGDFKTTYGELPVDERPTFEQREDIIYYGNSKANLLIYHSPALDDFVVMKMAISEPKKAGVPAFTIVDNTTGLTVGRHRVKISYAVRVISTGKIILCSPNSDFKEDDFGDAGREWGISHTNVAADINHEAFPAAGSLHPELEGIVVLYMTLRSDLDRADQILHEDAVRNEEGGSEFIYNTNTYYEQATAVFIEAGNTFLISKNELELTNLGFFLETEFLLPFGEEGNLIAHILIPLPNSPAFKIHKDRFTVGKKNTAFHGRLTTIDYLKLMHDPEFDFTKIKATNEDIDKIESLNEDLIYGKTNSVLVNYQGNVLQDEQIIEDKFGIFGDTIAIKRGAGYVMTSLNELRTFSVQGIGGTDLFGRILLDKNQVKYKKSLSLWLNDKLYMLLKVNRQNMIRFLILKQHEFFKRGGEFGVFEYVLDTKLTPVSIFEFENEVWVLAHNKLFGLTEDYIWGFNNLISVTNNKLKIPADKPVTDPPELTMNGFDSNNGIQGNGFVKFNASDTQFLEDTKAKIQNCFTTDESFSVFAKIKIADVTKSFNIMWLKDDANNEVFMQYKGSDTTLRFRIRIAGVNYEASPTVTLTNDKIHRVAFVKDGATIKVALDGAFLGTTGTFPASTFKKFADNFNVGGGDTSLTLSVAEISYLSVSNRVAITVGQITNTEHFKLFKFVDTDHPDVTESFEMVWQHSPTTGQRRMHQVEMRRQFAYLNNDVPVTARVDIDEDRDNFDAEIVPDAGNDAGIEWKEAKYKKSNVLDRIVVLGNYLQFLYKCVVGQGNNVTYRGQDLNIEEAAREQVGDDFRPANWLTQLNAINSAGASSAFSLFCGKTPTSLGATGSGTHENYFFDELTQALNVYTSESAGPSIHQFAMDTKANIVTDTATAAGVTGLLAANKQATLLAVLDDATVDPTSAAFNLEVFSIGAGGALTSLVLNNIDTILTGFGISAGFKFDAIGFINETTLFATGKESPAGAPRLCFAFNIVKSTGIVSLNNGLALPNTFNGNIFRFLEISPNEDFIFLWAEESFPTSLTYGYALLKFDCDKYILALDTGLDHTEILVNFPGVQKPVHPNPAKSLFFPQNVKWSFDKKFFYIVWMLEPEAPIAGDPADKHFNYVLQAYSANSDSTFTFLREVTLPSTPDILVNVPGSVLTGEIVNNSDIFQSGSLFIIDADLAAQTSIMTYDKDRIKKCPSFYSRRARVIEFISNSNKFFAETGTALNRFQT